MSNIRSIAPTTPNAERALSLPGYTRLLDVREVSAQVSMSRSTVWARVKAGEFPAPVRSGKRCTRWRESEVQAFIAAMTH
jgi:prophage regulatory protein